MPAKLLDFFLSVSQTLFGGLSVDWEKYPKLKKFFQPISEIMAHWFTDPATALATILTLLAMSAWIVRKFFWTRRSKLRRPEQFKLSADDPRHLAGRTAIRSETDSIHVSELGESLVKITAKLEAEKIKRIAIVLSKKLEAETDTDLRLSVCVILARLEIQVHPENSWLGIDNYVKSLRDPFAIGNEQKALLDGLGNITGQDFHGDLWQFVDWAQTEEGRKLVPSLE
jgi:hypothetical protein